MPWSPPVLIITSTHRIATMVARGQGLRPSEWTFISGMNAIRGRAHEATVLEYHDRDAGSWSLGQHHALRYLRERGAHVSTIREEQLQP